MCQPTGQHKRAVPLYSGKDTLAQLLHDGVVALILGFIGGAAEAGSDDAAGVQRTADPLYRLAVEMAQEDMARDVMPAADVSAASARYAVPNMFAPTLLEQNEETQYIIKLRRIRRRQPMEKEPIYYLEAANGMTVRVPQSKLESWKKRQDEIRAEMKAGRQPQPDPQMAERLASMLEKR